MTQPLEMDRLMEPLDYLLFRAEAEPRGRASMLSVALLDANPGLDAIREAFDRASRIVVRLRQHVVVPALPIAAPEWVVDPDFDLDFHVRRIRAPQPSGLRELFDLGTSMLASPLDTARPLWEVLLVEDIDVPGAAAAVLMKLNHALTDGVGGVELFTNLYDFERNPERPPAPPLPAAEDISPVDLVRKAFGRGTVNGALAAPGRVAGGVGRMAGVLMQPASALADAQRLLRSVQRMAGPPPVPPSPLLRRRGLGRRFDAIDIPLASLRAAAKAAGGSVNDAYIAGVCGALRLYHEGLGVPVDSVPLAMPVSLRTDDDPAGGNRFAGTRLAAPVGMVDPTARIQRVRELTLEARSDPAIAALGAVAPLLSRLPAPLLATLSSAAASTDVQASNVPGYPEPPFLAGAKVQAVYPIGPLPGVALMIVLLSQGGTCYIGAHYDTAAVVDGDRFERCLREGFDEILALAPRRTPPTTRSTEAKERS